MPTFLQRGHCLNCHQLNAYTQSLCERCHSRLPWADTVAVTEGEKCPHCEHFNTYSISHCQHCGKLLPWSNAPATRKYASGKTEKEQKSLSITIVACAIMFIIFCGWMIYSLT